ncbi:hypothetical protein [Metabacillus sp. RGM 3146]|uniref:hypothetical protein n=1 Tax=Metabacillus sp. RGM 3146 TaxID=3401092 RepID=UPI003B9AA47D
MTKTTKTEAVLWSIALPGFGQILNGHLVKGLVFIFLEILININSRFNLAIISSFHGEIQQASEILDYQWLLFYPCIYMFAMYDAYKFAQGNSKGNAFFPFAFGAYFVTVGLIYSSKVSIFGIVPGPVWLPIMMLLPGFLIGYAVHRIIRYIQKEK